MIRLPFAPAAKDRKIKVRDTRLDNRVSLIFSLIRRTSRRGRPAGGPEDRKRTHRRGRPAGGPEAGKGTQPRAAHSTAPTVGLDERPRRGRPSGGPEARKRTQPRAAHSTAPTVWFAEIPVGAVLRAALRSEKGPQTGRRTAPPLRLPAKIKPALYGYQRRPLSSRNPADGFYFMSTGY